MPREERDPCDQEIERRINLAVMAKEIHEQRVQQQAEMHEIKLELERAKVRAIETNGKQKAHPILQYIGVPGALLALVSALVLYHVNIALPAVKASTRESISQLLADPAFWAQVREVARIEGYKIADERTAIRNREMESIRLRIEADEAQIRENTKTLDRTVRRNEPGK